MPGSRELCLISALPGRSMGDPFIFAGMALMVKPQNDDVLYLQKKFGHFSTGLQA